MTIDLRKDVKALREHLAQKVEAYARKASKAPPVSAVEVGYEFEQAGWVYVGFDARPAHQRDGAWTRFKSRDLLPRPDWNKAAMALEEGKPVTLILPNGERHSGKLTEKSFASLLGRTIKGLLLQVKKDGVFAPLPRREGCQIDIEEFNGNWAWPAYEKLGKVNLI